MKLLIATSNAHKIVEMKSILESTGVEIVTPQDFDRKLPFILEDGDTFEANACKKAMEMAEFYQIPALADDSGLEVFALNNEPGIYSARYAGEDADDKMNLDKLLDEMRDMTDRRARFVCCVAIVYPDKTVKGTAEGEILGQIAKKPRGGNGFGYDPVFVPDDYELTFAELSSKKKDSMSHRANALKKAIKKNLFK
ncbi:MAG: RdgB/HAM1 family non-canonical purine NTP pyrophosphatase [Verrucomicrobiota bacterium]|nr:RdgB/HAM1 family non-canonical purine NTP pyrophosphatase [Verrucomicrobiota bacterium]